MTLKGHAMRHCLWLAVLLLAVTLTPARALVISQIAAVVNDEIITTYQLDQALKTQLTKLDKRPSPAQVGALRKELLSRLIEEALVQQRIAQLKLTVSEEEVETSMLDVQKQNNLTREELEQAILAQGLTMEQYRANLRQQILRYKLLGQEVRSKLDVSEREVRDYYRAHIDDYRLPPKVALSALTFPVPERAGAVERDAIRQAARTTMGRLRAGATMEDLASENSSMFGATASKLGGYAAGELDPDFAAAVQGVSAGQIGALVEKPDKLVILRVDEHIPGGLRQFEAVQLEIYQTIMDQKADARIKEWTQSLKQKAFIDVRI